MSNPRRLMLLMMLVLSVLPPLATGQDEAKKKLDRARALIGLFLDQKLDEFSAAGDETIRGRLTPDQLATVHAQLNFRLGAHKAETNARLESKDGFDTVHFTIKFERGTAAFRIVLNPSGALTGFWIDKVEPDVPYTVPDYVKPQAAQERPIKVIADEKFPLDGICSVPFGEPPYPGVVLVHGSGPSDMDETLGANKPFKDLSLGLTSRGIVVLRYEKRSLAYPHAYPADKWTPEAEVINDALAAVALLRRHNLVDPDHVFVIGHSLGGYLAPLIAEKDGKLGGMILMAANSRPLLTILQDQMQFLSNLDGVEDDRERSALEEMRKGIASVRAGKPEGSIAGAPSAYWASFEKLDPPAAALRTTIPMLILQGERDYQVRMEDFDLWKMRLNQRPNVDYRSYKRLNHLFMQGVGKGMSTPQEYTQQGNVQAQVVSEIADWILAHSPRPTSSPAPAKPEEGKSTQPPAAALPGQPNPGEQPKPGGR